MPITQEPTPPTEETSITTQSPGHLNQTQHEYLPNNPRVRRSTSDLAQAVESGNARDVDESRKMTPVPIEDMVLLRYLCNAATIKDLASLVASSYAARDVYELHKPIIIWKSLVKFLGRDGINDLLMCVYLDGECSCFSPGNGEHLGPAMLSWAAGELRLPQAADPDGDVVERMLCLFLGMANIVNRFLAQMYCAKSFEGQFHGRFRSI
ncbi:hypothetical protein N0V84_009350 [Fusarium piperis]|uniref:Uncharacterized protein n=1 Tax=Fusarium piperis TaxID=1435070 RepID=A0A9W8W6G1_9HYPO|nr:hypothetical protein N0V84_009350 [Fusarium piperis]